MKFRQLHVGDVVTLAEVKSVIMAIEQPHPLNPNFWMFVFWVFDSRKGRPSFDMLEPNYELIPGTLVHSDGLHTFRMALEAMRE